MTFRACSSPSPTRVKPQPTPAILSQESVHATFSITHHTRKRPSTGPRTTHGPQAAARVAQRREQGKATCKKERRIRCRERRDKQDEEYRLREQQDEEYRLREQQGLSPPATPENSSSNEEEEEDSDGGRAPLRGGILRPCHHGPRRRRRRRHPWRAQRRPPPSGQQRRPRAPQRHR
jgi:hypothetical protein